MFLTVRHVTDAPRIRLDKDPSLQPVVLEDEGDATLDLVSLLQGRLEEVYTALPQELLNLSEFELCDRVNPGPSDYKMRQNFTDAAAVARAKAGKIRVTSIYDGVIARQTFFDFYVTNPLKVAFITRPVVPHHAYYDAVFKEGLRKMFLAVKQYDLDPKNLATFMRIVEKAGDRVIGPVAQRIQMHQKQEISHSASPAEREVDSNDPAQIKAKIDELTAKMNQVKALEIPAKTVDDDD